LFSAVFRRLRGEARLLRFVAEFFRRFPWLGCVAWLAFCALWIAQVHPRRFGSTLFIYLDRAQAFWDHEPIYLLDSIGNYLYWPVSLMPLLPVLWLDEITAAIILTVLSVAILSWASIRLVHALCGPGHRHDAVKIAGVLLLINVPAVWFNIKYVQAQIPMTAGMMLACAAMMESRWRAGSAWLFFSAAVKPLSVVMILLSGALWPKMRLGLLLAVVLALGLPFALADAHYMVGEYRHWIEKLSMVGKAMPADWDAQVDFMTMLDSLHIRLPLALALAIRLIGAFVTLGLAWRLARNEGTRAGIFASAMVTGCYLTLFGPRNEYLSFLVLTPFLAGLGLLLILRYAEDRWGWWLILATLALGMHWAIPIDRVMKPAIVCFLYGWMLVLARTPGRWRKLIDGERAPGSHEKDPLPIAR